MSSYKSFNSLGGLAYNEYNLDNLPPLEITTKTVNPYERSENNSSVFYKAKNSQSSSTQITGGYLYNNVISNDRNQYPNPDNLLIKPVRTYDGLGGSMN